MPNNLNKQKKKKVERRPMKHIFIYTATSQTQTQIWENDIIICVGCRIRHNTHIRHQNKSNAMSICT